MNGPVKRQQWLVLANRRDGAGFAASLEARGKMRVVDAAEQSEALREAGEADAFLGKITPALLAAAERLRWVQAPTASQEHYLFPELI